MILMALFFLQTEALALGKAGQLPPSRRLLLENGFEAILIPNRATPLVTSVVVVRAGVVHETRAVSGISHMLEHLLWNGTVRRTQEQIYDEQDRYGFINNATTGTEQTSYFIMATREMAGRALDLQADMLLGSIFPEEKLAKEREIIVNEIAKDQVQDETAMSALFSARLYHPSALALPVIGTPDSVRAIPRDAIVAYYRARYVPNNMTAVIMGDFEFEEMEPLVRRYFGAAAPGVVGMQPRCSVNPAALGLTHARRTAGSSRLLWLAAPAPGFESSVFHPAWIVGSLLGEGLVGVLNARLREARIPGSFLDVSTGLDVHGSTSAYQVRASLEPDLAWADAIRVLLKEVTERLATGKWKEADLDRIRLGEKASLMRLWEKPHYFGLDRAPFIATAGWEKARDLVRSLSWVEPADLKDMARRAADPKGWAVFALGPDIPEDRGALAAAGATPGGESQGSRVTPASQVLVEKWKGPRAPEGPVSGPGVSTPQHLVTARATLENGLTVIVNSTDDSRVFAAHVLIRNRSAAEPAGKTGIVEILHRLAGAGTIAHPGASLDDALRAIGGSLKVADDPAIPYDDIYLSPEYSYVRLEALDEFAPRALELLREILYEPSIFDPNTADAEALESAKEQVLSRARQSATSARERSRILLAQGLWGAGHPFTAPFAGTGQTVESITLEDLRLFHPVYFSPRNIILGIGTSLRPEQMLQVLDAKLGRWPKPPAKPAAPPAPAPGPLAGSMAGGGEPGLVFETMKTPQAAILLGRLVEPAMSPGASPPILSALAAVLSRRMGDTLREKRGLAYSLGADASPLGGQIQFTASMGVLPEKVEEARSGLREVLASLVTSPPTQQEIDDAVRATSVRMLMRGLSRINRAWQRCIEEQRREGSRVPGAAGDAVVAQQVAAAARLLVDGKPDASVNGKPNPWVEAIVAPSPPETLR